MPDINPNKKTESLRVVLDFFKGESSLVTQIRLSDLTKDIDGKSLYQQIKLRGISRRDKTIVQAILFSFGIKDIPADANCPYKRVFQEADNLHELLLKLYNEKELYLDATGAVDYSRYRASRLHIGYLIPLIKRARPKISWPLIFFLGALLSLGFGAAVYFVKTNFEVIANWVQRTLPSVANWLAKTFSLLRNFAILGIINQVIILGWHWYETRHNEATTADGITPRLTFATLIALSNISANVICFLSGGTLSLAAATLFFLASIIEVVENLSSQWRLLTLAPVADDQPWEVAAQYERASKLKLLNRKTLWLTLVSSVLVITSVAIWCFLQPPFLITVACMSFAWCVSWAKETIIARMNEQVMNGMQTAISGITNQQSPMLLSPPQMSYETIAQLTLAQAVLVNRNRRLGQTNVELTQRVDRLTADNGLLQQQLNRQHRPQENGIDGTSGHQPDDDLDDDITSFNFAS